MRLPTVDAVVVGVGWAGGILAAELTKAGLKVVGLERGHARGVPDFQHDVDELRYAIDYEMMQDTSLETWTLRHNLNERALPIRQLGSFLPGTGEGGAGVHWQGLTWRFEPRDFTIRSSTIARYGASAIPTDSTIQDWGITYDELEPYYDKFEYMAGIAGKAGNVKGQIQPGGNPFEGPRARDYPVGPMKDAHAPTVFRDAAKSLGYHPFPSPSANLPVVYRNPDGIMRGECTYCGFCERFGCWVGAKADPTVTVLPVAKRSGNFELRTEANVFQIKHDGKRAQSVLYFDAAGNMQEQPANIIILTAYVFNNVRLLLLSQMGTPYDPVSGNGVVGKNYCYQVGGAGGSGFFDKTTFHRYMGSGANGYSIDDFNADNFDHSGLSFIGGGVISCGASGARPIQSLPVPPGTPAWGAQWKAAIRTYYDRVISVGMQGESIAYRTHFLDLDPTYRDAWGNPLIRITFDWEDNDRKMVAFGATKVKQILQATGATTVAVGNSLPPHYDSAVYQSTHNTGGAIIGADPGSSVVNNYLQMWDFDNVFVIGACSFPQNAGRNPTGTVGALAYRAADGIVNRYVKSPGPLV
jgi:gluconate 2-dehydrogenase alpha chain